DRLFADQRDLALEPALAQTLRRLAAGLAGADDDDASDFTRTHSGLVFGASAFGAQAALDAALPEGQFRLLSIQTTPDSRAVALPDALATLALGRRLGERIEPGDVICLSGNLGAGKTTLARGAIEAWTGYADEVPSPT